MIGLSFEEVKVRPIRKEIKTSVKITPDETRQFRVTTKVSGWVERLYVNQTGQFVNRGAPLLSVYSPELLSAEQEYLSARKARQRMGTGGDSDMSGTLDEIESAARERLRLLDMSAAQVDRIGKTGRRRARGHAVRAVVGIRDRENGAPGPEDHDERRAHGDR